MNETSPLLTVDQLAARWQKPAQWIYSNHHRLGMKVLKIGQQLRFPIKEVEQWEINHSH